MGRARGPKRRKSNHTDVVLVAHGKGPVKRTQLNPYDIAGSPDVEYEVREIKAHRKCYGVDQYLVGWEGWEDQHDTWEPTEHLPGSEDDIQEFLKTQSQKAEEAEARYSASKRKRCTNSSSTSAEEGDENDGRLEDAKDGKTKRRALVWDFYWVVKDGKRVVETVCKLCGPNSTPIPYCGNTSNLRSHISHVHQDAYCRMCIAEKKVDSVNNVENNTSTAEQGSQSAPGTIEAILPQVSTEKRDVLHKKFALWIVRRRGSLSICETDSELRDIFQYIFQGSYTPPTYKLVVQKVLELSGEARVRTRDALVALLAEGILPSIAGDIWSEGGVCIFGILAYWLDLEFERHEKLLAAIPFSDVRHTGPEILAATKKACAETGVGTFTDLEDTVTDCIHCTASDSASNIVSGWEKFDGHECNCHILALCVLEYLKTFGVKEVFRKLRGMTAHFSHSIIGVKLLQSCQEKHDLPRTKPPKDNDTRTGWSGAYKQASWYRDHQEAIRMYDIDHPRKAANAAANPDGSVYKDYKMEDVEWDVVSESVYILNLTTECIDLLQGTDYATANLVLPLIGALAHKLDKDTPVKYEKSIQSVNNESVKKARENLHKAVCRRYFQELMECKLEDFCVASFLDPRYKNFDFKCVEKWNMGEFLSYCLLSITRHCDLLS
ncbi:hypothetical protein CYMTET_13039 [Cymbomonas tetramitiformis]|uniref:Chromo domain-containing protein n=1 Tax=Cymbomonas tetramitiformis TaxID=36881 RepID=A0AAE0GJ95_9CHLO|nr:hypothetical protein CYMTET_13039 [Cymbomonas tetramitiformis]